MKAALLVLFSISMSLAHAGVTIKVDQHVSNDTEIVSVIKSAQHESQKPISLVTSNGLTYRLSEYSLRGVGLSFSELVAMVNQTQPETSPYDLVISAGWDSIDYKQNIFYLKSIRTIGLIKKN